MKTAFSIANNNKLLSKSEQLDCVLKFRKLHRLFEDTGLEVNNKNIPTLIKSAKTKADLIIIRQGLAARDLIVFSNQAMVIKMANALKTPSLNMEELIQIGNTGILIALKKFDVTKDIKFSSYAYFWIKAEMFAAVHRIPQIYSPRQAQLKNPSYSYKYVSMDDEESLTEYTDENISKRSTLNTVLEQLSEYDCNLLTSSYGLDGSSGVFETALNLGCSVESVYEATEIALSNARNLVS